MDSKILFFDIDGTISDERTGVIPESTIDAIHQAQNNGHLCFINTGRPLAIIEEKIRNIGFDGYICGCGTYIEYQGKTIMHATLDHIIRQTVIKAIFNTKVEAILEGREGSYFMKNSIMKEVLRFKENCLKEHLKVYEYDQDEVVDFDKMTVFYNDESNIESMKNVLKKYFSIIQRDAYFIEVVPLGYSKASGIAYLLDYLGYDIDDTISFGDSTNDLAMLKYTREAVVMGNGNPAIFDKATYITSELSDDGIEKALKHFKLI